MHSVPQGTPIPYSSREPKPPPPFKVLPRAGEKAMELDRDEGRCRRRSLNKFPDSLLPPPRRSPRSRPCVPRSNARIAEGFLVLNISGMLDGLAALPSVARDFRLPGGAPRLSRYGLGNLPPKVSGIPNHAYLVRCLFHML